MMDSHSIRIRVFRNSSLIKGKAHGNGNLRFYFFRSICLTYEANIQSVGIIIDSLILHRLDLLFCELLAVFLPFFFRLHKALCLKNNILRLSFFIGKCFVIIEHFYGCKAFDFNILALSAKLI